MPLLCSCDYYRDYEPGDSYYCFWDVDFEKLGTSRGRRCKSCKTLIKRGSLCIKFDRVGYPHTDVEAKITGYISLEEAMGDEATIKLSPHYLCESCGEIYLNLVDLGFECISPEENMQELLDEYIFEYKPQKLEVTDEKEAI